VLENERDVDIAVAQGAERFRRFRFGEGQLDAGCSAVTRAAANGTRVARADGNAATGPDRCAARQFLSSACTDST